MTFDTYFIGAESLLIQCAEILLARGHRIRGVITDNAEIVSWARQRELVVLDPGKGLADRIKEPFDWLFSVANLRIIPSEMLAKAKSGAVNFHDGPLPRYAGLNSPNWALLAGETEHGVTWHRIEGGVDEGNILAQRIFGVQPLATALELNQRCYESAIDSFPDVLDRLERGEGVGVPQDLTRRTYFAKNDRPRDMAVLSFEDDADTLVRTVRALDYGDRYPNPLALAKLVVDGEVLCVRKADVAHLSGEPGTVLEADPSGAVIAARMGSIRVYDLVDSRGRHRCPGTLAGKKVVARIADDQRARLTEVNSESARHEDRFAKVLERLDPIEIPFLSAAIGSVQARSINLPASNLEGAAFCAGIVAFLSRIGGKSAFHIGYRPKSFAGLLSGLEAFFVPTVPILVDAQGKTSDLIALLSKEIERAEQSGPLTCDLVARRPLAETAHFDVVLAPTATDLVSGSAVTFSRTVMYFDASRLRDEDAADLIAHLNVLLAAFGDEETPVARLPLLTDAERRKILHEWNATSVPFPVHATIHSQFEEQVDRTPDEVAVVFEGMSLTFSELDQRANRVAHALVRQGLRPGAIVGLYCFRSLELVAGALGILKAGGAYLPLDPEYPAERISLMLEDSRAKIVISHQEARSRLRTDASVLVIDADPSVARSSAARLAPTSASSDLAYVIYTSGSTGKPKGVMVEHRNAVNFFVGMDARIPLPTDKAASWLAVTSLSFDISVLELFWTLTRGVRVVLHRDRERASSAQVAAEVAGRGMRFGLFYWGNDDGPGPKKYEVLLEGAKLADRLGFSSLWTPERHFHAFGGPYPNPAITGAAVCAVTQNLEIRSGSCVSPLHHPIRIAEEWAVIDNLSNGRAGLAFASGWHPDDFVLNPDNRPPNNKKAMFESIETVRKLWRGEAVDFPKGDGTSVSIVTQPRPVSPELAVWVTTAGNPDTYREAARIKAHVLTHLLGQSIAEVADKIRIYRDELRAQGLNPADYKVTLMLHTYLDETREKAREVAREPMKNYLRSAAGLIKQYAWAFPAFKKPAGVENPLELDLRSLTTDETEAILDFAFDRYFEDSGFFGTIEDAKARVNQLKAIGVDEIGCLIDYGISVPQILASIARVGEVIAATAEPVFAVDAAADFSVGALLRTEQVTHLQCTPSMARMLLLDERAKPELSRLSALLLGGEALPGSLVAELRSVTSSTIENMYGPTETTVWSSTFTAESTDGITPVGTPIANTQLYVLDANGEPVPPLVPGELYIAGAGVTRGYLFRDDLTKERFVGNPFAKSGLMYRTGDLVRYRRDGVVDFIGRVDHQVKIRGYRIELGEIESRLSEVSGVREAVVVAREDVPGDKRLVAYLTTTLSVPEESLRAHLLANVPEYMVPSHFVFLESFPLTPNAKVDRKRLPKPEAKAARRTAEPVELGNDVEMRVAAVWKQVLGVHSVGARDHFFELGGHSLLAVQAHRELRLIFPEATIAITDIFRFPVLADLAEHIGGGAEASEELNRVAARAAARRDMMRKRR